jgi:hypothetical protein
MCFLGLAHRSGFCSQSYLTPPWRGTAAFPALNSDTSRVGQAVSPAIEFFRTHGVRPRIGLSDLEPLFDSQPDLPVFREQIADHGH